MNPKRKFRMMDDPFYNLSKVVSATECTGLTPAAVEDEDQGEAYASLYAIHRQKPTQPKS